MPDNKLFQIYHADLAELERVIPDIAEALMVHMSGRQKTQLRRVQAILSNVRWNYGPPSGLCLSQIQLPARRQRSLRSQIQST